MGNNHYMDESESLPLLPSYEPVLSPKPRSRSRCCVLSCLFTVLALLFSGLAIILTLLVSRSVSKDFPPDGPGIGFVLSTHYASVAIRNEDGTIDNVARIEASQDYISLLQRLSLPSSRHPAPPYHSASEKFSDRPRQLRRAARKRLGYPASPDVGILASLLQELADAAQAHLPSSRPTLTSALAVIPNAMALYSEDVQDALEYIGLHALTGHNVYAVPRALPAAYAGYGMGLCEHPENFEECLEEEKGMERRGVVIVDAGQGALATDSRGMDTPMYVYNDQYATLDWHAWGREEGGTTDEYRDRIAGDIGYAVGGLVQRSLLPAGAKVVDEVLMAGEQGEDQVLKDIVREEVAKYQDEEVIIRCKDPQWVVARGAAELAKRVLVQRGRVT